MTYDHFSPIATISVPNNCQVIQGYQVQVKVKVRVYSLESSQNLPPNFTFITFADHWKRPHSYKLRFLDYGIHKEARFRKVTISSQLPINAG